MSVSQRTPWTLAEYLAWEADQPIRHELVDGEVYAMGGGTAARDMMSLNIRMALRPQLDGTGCRPHGSDLKVETATGNARYPDAHIDCGRYAGTALTAAKPVAVFEVLSKSTARFDRNLKLRDYAATPSIQYYVLLAQDAPHAIVYARDADGIFDPRQIRMVRGLDAAIELPDVGVVLAMRDIYRDIELAAETAEAGE